jgi:hypothetical protein
MRLIIFAFVIAIQLVACNNNTRSDKPSWIDNPGNGAVGSSTTHVKGRYYQEELAIARARERLAAQYGVEISSVQTIHERIVNENAYVTSDKQVLQRIQNAVVKTHVRATWHDKEKDELWVWVYPVTE